MRFLKADYVVLINQSFEVMVLLLAGDLGGGSGPEKPSRSPRYATKASFGNMDTCILFLTGPPTVMCRSRKRATWDGIVGILVQR